MSRSNQIEIINPSKYFFEWQGSTGKIKYFDKNKGEKGEQVILPLPFSFLVLDKLATIKGFSDEDSSGFWSNEIRSIKDEKLTVRTKKGIYEQAYYPELKSTGKGAKYSQSVYIAYKDGNELVLANFQIFGSAIGAWIDLCKGKDIYKYAITISGATAAKKGATNFFIPEFKLSAVISPETEAKAIELDKTLQDYLNAYFKRNNSHEEVAPADVVTDKQKEDIKSFEQPKNIGRDVDIYADRESEEPIDTFVDEGNSDLPF